MSVSAAALRPLPRAFFARPAQIVARELIGVLLASSIDAEETIGRIVETEAYIGPGDPASHAAARIGMTARNRTMFGEPARAYVYRSYGVHWCLNAVTDRVGFPAAVLIRALEPVAGIDAMRRRRWRGGVEGPDTRLSSGPGNLTVALGITGALDGHPLDSAPLIAARGDRLRFEVAAGPRIGISRARDWPLRFVLRGSPHLSRRERSPAP